jgi:hypothetical protein
MGCLHRIAVAGCVIALVVVVAVAAFIPPGCAKPGWSVSEPGGEQFLTSATQRDVTSRMGPRMKIWETVNRIRHIAA